MSKGEIIEKSQKRIAQLRAKVLAMIYAEHKEISSNEIIDALLSIASEFNKNELRIERTTSEQHED